jgi:tetratricopeptide (TPR) repeat protein
MSEPSHPLRQALESARGLLSRGDHAALMALIEPILVEGTGSDTREVAEARTLLAHACFGLARLDAALRQASLAADGWRVLGDGPGLCRALRLKAFALTECGDHARALAAAHDAFVEAEAHGLEHEALQLLVLMGTVNERLGDFMAGESLLLNVLSRARDRHDTALIGAAQNSLLTLLVAAHASYTERGDAQACAAVAGRIEIQLPRAMQLDGEDTNLLQRAIRRSNIGAALAACGRTAEAVAQLESSIALSREQGFDLVTLRALLRLCRLRLAAGDVDQAAEAIAHMVPLSERTAHPQASEELAEVRVRLADRVCSDVAERARLAEDLARLRCARQERIDRLRALALGAEDDVDLPSRVDQIEIGKAQPSD